MNFYAAESFPKTTAGVVPPSGPGLGNNVMDYIPVFVTVPLLCILLTGVITVVVMVIAKVK